MGIVSWLFGSKQAQQKAAAQRSNEPGRDARRRELLRMAVRDTLHKNGIPAAWIGAEILASPTPGRERGVHLRLLVKHWEPKILECAVALQQGVKARVLCLDPLSSAWITGISWRFDIADETVCPDLPDPAYWQTFAPAAVEVRADSTSLITPRAVLERLLGSSDRVFAANDAGDGGDFTPTQPMAITTAK